MNSINVDSSLPIPLHRQIENGIRALIQDQAPEEGEFLFTEVGLGEQCGVSLVTVRQAVNTLVLNGLLERRRAKGVFLAKGGIRASVRKNRRPEGAASDRVIMFVYRSRQVSGGAAVMFMAEALTAAANRRGVSCVHVQVPFGVSFPDYLDKAGLGDLPSLQGILFVANYQPDARDVEFVRTRRIPAVTISESPDPRFIPSLRDRHEDEAGLAVRHMHAHGCRRIALVDGHLDGISQLRLDSYRQTLAELKLPFDPRLVVDTVGWERAKGVAAAKTLLKNNVPCDAILSYGDFSSVGLVDTLAHAGVRIPGEVRLFIFDCFPWLSGYFPFHPSGTVFDAPAIAEQVFAIFEELRGGRFDPAIDRAVPLLFHQGDSCGCRLQPVSAKPPPARRAPRPQAVAV